MGRPIITEPSPFVYGIKGRDGTISHRAGIRFAHNVRIWLGNYPTPDMAQAACDYYLTKGRRPRKDHFGANRQGPRKGSKAPRKVKPRPREPRPKKTTPTVTTAPAACPRQARLDLIRRIYRATY